MRNSEDRASLNAHSCSLLQLCSSSWLRVCNGRVGPSSGAATSFCVPVSGKAVVDSFAISSCLLPHVQLEVLGWHLVVVLT